jgi:hypothetical protein
MKFEAIKAAILNLEAGEQRRVVLEVLPEIWPSLVGDESCLKLLRKLVDEESVRSYQAEHMDHL